MRVKVKNFGLFGVGLRSEITDANSARYTHDPLRCAWAVTGAKPCLASISCVGGGPPQSRLTLIPNATAFRQSAGVEILQRRRMSCRVPSASGTEWSPPPPFGPAFFPLRSNSRSASPSLLRSDHNRGRLGLHQRGDLKAGQ